MRSDTVYALALQYTPELVSQYTLVSVAHKTVEKW